MRMHSAVMAAIFQKQLRLSSQGRKRHSMGEIVNYIAVGVYRLRRVSMVVSYGMNFFSSNTPLIIFWILNIPIVRILQYNQEQFMVAQDERLRATLEVLNNIKIIKLQSWGEKFRALIESLRDVEFKWLRDIQITNSFGSALYWMATTFVSTVIFAGTAALKSAPLNAGTIFTVLVALRIICDPVRMLPEALSVLIQVKVLLDRISIFLLEDRSKMMACKGEI